jgi:hypothetical protein
MRSLPEDYSRQFGGSKAIIAGRKQSTKTKRKMELLVRTRAIHPSIAAPDQSKIAKYLN